MTQRPEHVDLASSRKRLDWLLRALFDAAPPLVAVESAIATRRPFISNLGIHLPEAGRALQGAAARRWYDAAALHAAAHLRYSTHRFERGSLKPIQLALIGLLEDARVECMAIAEMPGLRALWLGFHFVEPAHGGSFVVLMLRLARSLLDPGYDDPHPWVRKGRRLFVEATGGGASPHMLSLATVREMASLLGNDIGQMRLQFNSRDYVVEPAYRDDNGYLWPPDPAAPAQTLATADPVSLAQPIDGEPAPARPDSAETLPFARLQYREWDRLVDGYRHAWCTVLENRPPPGDPRALQAGIERHAALLSRLERLLRAGQVRERVRLRAQLHGDGLDVDAAVRAAIDRRVGRPASHKVHQRCELHARDTAALVLIDSSASTAGAVLDLAREAALLTSMTLANAGDHCAIHAFASNGRHEVRYERAVDFGEPLDAAAIARLAGLCSRLSTRMGAALRHACALLSAQPQRRRLLLFITDGEPHDIDIFDRRYLIDDARRAVLEASRGGVTVFCVTLDPAADDYVRTIFGARNYRVLDRIESLPQVLPAMLLRMMR